MGAAIFATIVSYIVGLFLDANIGFEPSGFLSTRILFPILVMGAFILHRMDKLKKEQ